ncbi:MAG: hypothetical protein KC454_01330 [Flavobacteriales bacterium]|nr:hypothetical protein [Flavobacteriales bacterium]
MKAVTMIIAGLFITTLSMNSFGQKKGKEIKKEIRMEDNNGKRVLTIITTENGNVMEEVYEGRAADLKMTELRSDDSMEFKEESQEVRVEMDKNGQNKLTVITKKNGQEMEEVYVGLKADQKMKELGISDKDVKVIKP